MVVGIIIGVLVIVACLMLFTKHSKNLFFQRWNHRIHKVIGWVLLILSIVHLAVVWPLRLQRPIGMYVLGVTMIVAMAIIIASYYFKKTLGKSWRIIHRIAAVGVVICLIGHIYMGIHSLQVYKELVSNITITSVDLNKVKDGEYIGEKNVGYVYCKVKVTVKDHTMVGIDILEHRTERGKPAEAVTYEMLTKQDVKVDAITGATNSSTVIMKAAENALNNTTD